MRLRCLDEGMRATAVTLKVSDHRYSAAFYQVSWLRYSPGGTESRDLTSEHFLKFRRWTTKVLQKRFMLHYNFPHSLLVSCRTGNPGRREIGHGMLAERSLEWIVPDSTVFPYTIRQVSEILESNGSSSMASVCSGSLAMCNAGVPIKAPVAGIAMGLIMEGDRYAILSDIQGLEDHLGDMDFKVAGTETGITAFQLDIKIEGITPEIMKVALEQAKEGRLHILKTMNTFLSAPEKEVSVHAPKIKTIKVKTEKIGEIIGPGGRVIKKIVEDTGAEVNIDDTGKVVISSVSAEAITMAEKIILGIAEDVEVVTYIWVQLRRSWSSGLLLRLFRQRRSCSHIQS